MDNKKQNLYLFGLVYAIFLGSLIYIIPEYKDLWLVLEVIVLPNIYMIGYEILIQREKEKSQRDLVMLTNYFQKRKDYIAGGLNNKT